MDLNWLSAILAQASVCNRTIQVSNAIVTAVSGKTASGALTASGDYTLSVRNHSTFTTLKPGDFTCLTSLSMLYPYNNTLGSLRFGCSTN